MTIIHNLKELQCTVSIKEQELD